ncbi:nuclear transcription factor Y subunit B-1-like [Solanum dulcamara]|uniref:nuclear transcription factor Y subunit B-1-like n=1 Tax=Solanum dulcamara TaxID=45834 RepID=UPI00248638D1|nr:nuclear transcription factor Y subunit B-1-like [Solanum dulcamara]
MEMSMELSAHLNQEVDECIIQEQDQFMTNMVEIMHMSLPPHTKISDKAKQTMKECVSEFICFVTCAAYDHCQREQRNTITAKDVLWVASKFGFDDYMEPLTLYLHSYPKDDGGEPGSRRRETLLKRPMVDQAPSCNIMPYHLPPNFPVAHHHFVYPPLMRNGDMKGDASTGSTSHCVMALVDSEVESPAEEENE